MIRIDIFHESGAIRGMEITGHADYAEYGQDIVCAAVSSQVTSVENSLERLLGIQCDLEVNEKDGGYLKMMLPDISDTRLHQDAQLLLRHLAYAYAVLEENYPEYIHIKTISQ